jgi:hypothetical protein
MKMQMTLVLLGSLLLSCDKDAGEGILAAGTTAVKGVTTTGSKDNSGEFNFDEYTKKVNNFLEKNEKTHDIDSQGYTFTEAEVASLKEIHFTASLAVKNGHVVEYDDEKTIEVLSEAVTTTGETGHYSIVNDGVIANISFSLSSDTRSCHMEYVENNNQGEFSKIEGYCHLGSVITLPRDSKVKVFVNGKLAN